MLKILLNTIFLFIFLQMTGCAGLAEMKKAEFIDSVSPESSMVNIVRPNVFLGDGAEVEVWDGDKFIGTLSAGTLIQYKTDPGNHTFLVYNQGSWGIAKGELISGKTYYLKFNIGFGFVTLGVAKSSDSRISVWNRKLDPMVIDYAKSNPVSAKEIADTRKILQDLEVGKAKYEKISNENAI